MAAPVFLAMRVNNGTVGVYRFAGGTWTIVGNTFGAAVTASYNQFYADRVRQLGGDLFVLDNAGDIRKYTSGTGNWDVQFSTGIAFSPSVGGSGLIRIDSVAGGPELFVVGNAGTFTSVDGVSWTARAASPSLTSAYVGRAYVFEGARVFVPISNNATYDFYEYNRESDSWTAYAITGRVTPRYHFAGFCTLNNRLLVCGCFNFSATTSAITWHELVGSSFVAIGTVGSASTGWINTLVTLNNVASPQYATGGKCAPALFEYGGAVYIVIYATENFGATGFGSWVSKNVPLGGAGTGFTQSNVSLVTIPTSRLAPSSGGTCTGPEPAGTSQFHSWTVMKDTDSLPGMADVYLLLEEDRGRALSNHELYKWNGDGTLMTSDGTIAVGLAPPMIVEGGGDRIWTQGEMNIELIGNPTPLPGGEEFRFKAWGDPGPANKQVTFWFSALGQSPNTKATLFGTPYVVSGPAPAPTLNVGLKQLEGVTADGVTIYAVNRNNNVDGVPTGSREGIAPSISV